MATDLVVVSNLLCFLSNKYGKCAIRQLKSVIIDFYDVSDVCLSLIHISEPTRPY